MTTGPTRHFVKDSATGRIYETKDGLAFTLGVTAIEAEIARDPNRVFSVCFPNDTVLYIVVWNEAHVIITRVAGS